MAQSQILGVFPSQSLREPDKFAGIQPRKASGLRSQLSIHKIEVALTFVRGQAESRPSFPSRSEGTRRKVGSRRQVQAVCAQPKKMSIEHMFMLHVAHLRTTR